MGARAVPQSKPTDSVGRVLPRWKQELPSLDLGTEGIVERIQKLNKYLDRMLNETLAEFRLDRGEWMVLTMLRRAGKPYRQSPGVLARVLGLSAAAMTNRLDRLEEAGLVRRLPNPADRRAVEVELTDEGRRRWEESIGAQAQKEFVVASALDEGERDQLNELLLRLMLEFEKPAAGEAAG